MFHPGHFVLTLLERHSFPMQKYSLLRYRLTDAGLPDGEALPEPHAAGDEEFLRAAAPP